MSPRDALKLALACWLVMPLSARADTSTSTGDLGGEGGGPFAGLLQAPEANLFTGGLSQVIPIRIPPGRKMATPDLKLVYSTGGGGDVYGEGWAMPLGSIERSGKWGVPRCTGSIGFDKTDEFVLSLNGSAVELVNFGSGPGGSTVYRPRTDQSFLEALRRPDDTWEVFDRSGMRYRFGTTTESRRTRDTACGFTSVWAITQIVDPNGNTVDFTYFGGYMLTLDKVQYGGTTSNHAFQIRFDYQQHPPPFVRSWRNGVFTWITASVDRIHVEAKTSEGGSFGSVRIYDLEYDHDFGTPPAGCNAPDRVLLCRVSVNDGMPTQSFEYSSATFGLAATTVSQPRPGIYNSLRAADGNGSVLSTVMDINGDGRLDFVRAGVVPRTFTIYSGLATGGISSTVSTLWCANGETISWANLSIKGGQPEGVSWTFKETVDLTGDGLPDYVDSTETPWKVYPGSLSVDCPDAGGSVPGFVSSPINWAAPEDDLARSEQDGGWTYVWKRLVDMNGDGRPDLVIASGAGPWRIYLNNGQGFVDTATGATDMSYGTGATAGPISMTARTGNVVDTTTRELFDFNGDGLPDLVVSTLQGDAYQVYLNNGQSFDAPIWIPGVETDAIRRVVDRQTFVDFLDVSGDGLPDRVRVDNGHWQVSINQGTSLATEQDWGVFGEIRKYTGSKGNTEIDLVDWNHDGILDRVNANTGGGTTWTIRLGLPTSGPAIQPYLMTSAKNGAGGEFYPTYQPSTRFENTLLPFKTWVVTATRRTDGLCSGTAGACLDAGHEIQRTYEYADGYFHGPTRELRGFGEVTENYVHSSTAAPTSKRIVHFSQSDHTRGAVEKEETIGGGNTPIRTETFTWLTQADGDRTQVFLYEKKTEEFDADGGSEPPLCRLDRNNWPDVYGRVSTRCTVPCGGGDPGGCAIVGEGKVTTTTVWADPSFTAGSEPAVRERPASVSVSYVKPGGGSETLSQQSFTYFWPEGNVHQTTTTGDATTGGNAVVMMAYDAHGNMTSVTDARGGISTSTYTGTPFQLFPSSETNAVGHTVQKQWDLRYGKATQVTGPNGEVTVATYDAAGRITCEAKPGQSCTGPSRVPSVEYSYVLGYPGSAFWEVKHSRVEIKTREPNNTTVAPAGYLLTRVFTDALGRQRATATWRVIGAGNSLYWVVSKQTEYDAMGAATKTYAPYQAGSVVTGGVYLLESPTSAASLFSYLAPFGIDPTNRIRSATAPDGTTTTTQYAAAWTHGIDHEGNKTSSQVDFLGREKARRLYSGTSTLQMQFDYTYDGLNRLLTTTVGNSTVTNSWDPLGRKRQVTDPDSGTWLARYDLNGNLILQDDPKAGQRVESCYDAVNRVVLQCSYASDGTAPETSCNGTPTCGTGGAEIARYTYDTQPADSECGGPGRIGQLTSVTDTSGGECFAYDTRGRVTTQKKTILFNAVSTTAKTAFTYDQADHLLTVQYPDDPGGTNPVDYGYQADGLPDTIEQIISGVEYDLFGRTTKITSLWNTEDVYSYDTAGTNNFRLETIRTTQTSTGTPFLDLAYGYSPRGKLEKVIDDRDAGTARSNGASYCYDGLGRLTRLNRDPSPGGNPCTTTAEESFDHDSNGNVTAKNGTSFGFAAGPHQPTSFGEYTSISYDENGSRTFKNKGGGTQDEFIYDARGLLTQVKRWISGSLISSQTNVYDYAGIRVVRAPSATAGSPTIRTYNRFADAYDGMLTRYHYLGDRLVATWILGAPQLSEVDPGVPQPPAPPAPLSPQLVYSVAAMVLLLLFLPLGGQRRIGVRVSFARSASVSLVFLAASAPVVLVAGCTETPAVRLLHVDHLGSTQVVTDWGGNIVRQMRYTAYGEIRGRFGPNGYSVAYGGDTRFEFTGYETDFAGLEYAGARFFDPELAQFASHDPAGQFASPYAYGPGDPINGTDPTGAVFLIDDLVYIIVAAAVLATLSAIGTSIDTYIQTGSFRAAIKAGNFSLINSATLGAAGLTRAEANGEGGSYLESYALDSVTGGIYGTARAFANGQYATGAVGVVRIVYTAYAASQTMSAIVSGNETVIPLSPSAVNQDVQLASTHGERNKGFHVNLLEHEAAGGHTLKLHVGKTLSFLRHRIDKEHIPASSTFRSMGDAAGIVNAILNENRAEVEALRRLPAGATAQLTLTSEFSRPTGYSVIAGQRGYQDVFSATVIVRSPAVTREGFLVWTAFPHAP
jgi:RHS repeat-associated protein